MREMLRHPLPVGLGPLGVRGQHGWNGNRAWRMSDHGRLAAARDTRLGRDASDLHVGDAPADEGTGRGVAARWGSGVSLMQGGHQLALNTTQTGLPA
jgi:hypothetical protein